MLEKRKAKNGKRSLALLMIMVLMGSMPIIRKFDAQAAVTLSGSQVASYCNAKVGSSYPAGYCLAWVASVFRELGAGSSSGCCAYNYGRQHLSSTSANNIPIGADVFFSGSTTRCSNCGNTCGHVAIYVGDGYIVHSYNGKVHKDRLSTVMGWSNYSYMGWGYHGNVIINGGSSVVGEQTISNGRYHIVSNLNENMGLDVAGASKNNEANINLYSNINDNSQTFDVTYLGNGYYKLINSNSGKAVDVAAGIAAAGTNVWSYDYNGSNAQKWIIKESGDGFTYNIISACGGLYLDVNGGAAKNGTNIQIYTGNGSNAQKWKFVAVGNNVGKTVADGEYHIVSALDNNKGIDVFGAGKANGTNVQLYSNVKDDAQTFMVTYLGDGYYKIASKYSGKSLDVTECRSYKNTNVRIYDWNNSNAQKWIIKQTGDYYNIVTKSSGMYLDISGASTTDGTNIQVYTENGSNAQKWKFVPIVKETPKTTEVLKNDSEVDDSVYKEQNSERVVVPEIENEQEDTVEDEKNKSEENKNEEFESEDTRQVNSKPEDSKLEETIPEEYNLEEIQQLENGENEVDDQKEDVFDEKDAEIIVPNVSEMKEEEIVTQKVQEHKETTSVTDARNNDDSYRLNDYNAKNIDVETPEIRKLKNVKNKTIQIQLTSIDNADGYEYTVAKITGSTLKKFKKQVRNTENNDKILFKGAKTYSTKSTKVKLAGLKKSKKYAVVSRAYKIIDNKKYYSAYSSVKCVKIKK